jgi:hypothetical protein
MMQIHSYIIEVFCILGTISGLIYPTLEISDSQNPCKADPWYQQRIAMERKEEGQCKLPETVPAKRATAIKHLKDLLNI